MAERFLGDPYATREEALRKMLDLIGRDVSDLDFTAAGGTPGADVPTEDPDVNIAWQALEEVYSEVSGAFWSFNTVEVDVQEAGGQYTLPASPFQDTAAQPASFGIASARIAIGLAQGNGKGLGNHQPADLDLIYLGAAGTTAPTMFDRFTNSDTGFAGKGRIRVEIAYFYPWEKIPFVFRKFIVLAAALRFAKRATTSDAIIGLNQDDINRARVDMEQFDLEMRPPNFLEDGGLVMPGIADRGPF